MGNDLTTMTLQSEAVPLSHDGLNIKRRTHKNILTSYIINNNSHSGVSDVRRDKGAETLLSCCIPQLQSHCTVL